MSDDCPFCQIVSGDLPSYDVYETDAAYAFLDINPVSRGHTLVIPRTHAETLTDLDPAEVRELFDAVHAVADMLEVALEPDGLNLLQSNGDAAGQEVPHVHVHLVPRHADDGFDFSFESDELAEDEAEALLAELDAGRDDI